MTKIKKEDLVPVRRFSSVAEMFDDMELRHKNRPWFVKVFNFVVWRIISPIWDVISPVYNWRRIYYIWQKITRGFDDTELWNLEYTFAKFIVPRLKRFKKMTHGWSPNLPSYKGEDTKEEDAACIAEWNEILGKMINAFELILDDYGTDRIIDKLNLESDKSFKEHQDQMLQFKKEIAEGLELFAKYFSALWD